MLYTIMPNEVIMNKDENPQRTQTVSCKGVLLEGVREGNMLKITRLISSDPKYFLDSSFCPGNYIKINN